MQKKKRFTNKSIPRRVIQSQALGELNECLAQSSSKCHDTRFKARIALIALGYLLFGDTNVTETR